MSEAYVTLATTDAYCMGCLVVGKCLRRHGSTKSLVVLITPSVSTEARLSLENVFDEVIVVDVLDSRDRAHLSLLGRPELGITFTKLHCWTLTRYTKCVFLDADTLVLCNVDELFEREELSASPDPGWPDCFNSGVFVFRPSLETHSRLLEHANVHGSFDGGDQGLLNSFFNDWAVKDIHKHLPFIYNLSANAIYTYLPAFHKYGQQAKIVHFLGRSKPWQLPSNQHSLSGADPNRKLEKYLHLWWAEYYSQSQSHVSGSHELKNVLLIESPSQPLASSSSHTTTYPQSQISDPESLKNKETTLNQSPDLLNLNENCSSACRLMEEKPQVQSDTEVKSAGESENLGASEIREPPVTLDGKVLGAEAAEDFSPDVQEATLHTPPDESPSEISEHRRRWEEGHIDYMGRDAFENIRIKLDKFLK